MFRWLFRRLGFRMMHRAVAGGRRPPLLDFGLGFALMRDRRVSVGTKLLAVALGAGAIVLLGALELPIEAMVVAVLNLLGLEMLTFIDGLELLLGPALFGALFLTRLAPASLVAELRRLRAGAEMPAPPRDLKPVRGSGARA